MEWETKDKDLTTARDIIGRYYEDPQEQMVGIQEISALEDGGFHIERADWVIELEETFEKQYGPQLGIQVTRRVLTTLMTQGETMH